jgi:hypothetical protein
MCKLPCSVENLMKVMCPSHTLEKFNEGDVPFTYTREIQWAVSHE